MLSLGNVGQLKRDANSFSHLLNELFEYKISQAEILEALAHQFNYDSWNELNVVNRCERYYSEFDLTNICHISAISEKLSTNINVSRSHILVCGGLLQLGVTDVSSINVVCNQEITPIQSFKDIESIKSRHDCIWLTDDLNDSSRILTENPKAAHYERMEMTLGEMRDWLPELSIFLQKKLRCSNQFMIVTKHSVLWRISDQLNSYQEENALIRIRIHDENIGTREVFYPVLVGGNEDDFWYTLFETLDELCLPIPTTDCENLTDTQYACSRLVQINELESQYSAHLLFNGTWPKNWSGKIQPDYLSPLNLEIFSQIMEFYNSAFNRKEAYFEFRKKCKYKSRHGKKIEFWLNSASSKKLKRINNKLHRKRQTEYNSPYAQQMIQDILDRYWNDRFSDPDDEDDS